MRTLILFVLLLPSICFGQTQLFSVKVPGDLASVGGLAGRATGLHNIAAVAMDRSGVMVPHGAYIVAVTFTGEDCTAILFDSTTPPDENTASPYMGSKSHVYETPVYVKNGVYLDTLGQQCPVTVEYLW